MNKDVSLFPSLSRAGDHEQSREEEMPDPSQWSHHSQLFVEHSLTSWRNAQFNLNEIKTYNRLIGQSL